VKEHTGTAGADGSAAESCDNLLDDEQRAFAIEPVRDLDADFLGAGGGLGTGVVVAKDGSAHGNRLAMEPAGHYVTTFGDHEVPFLGMGYSPSPSGWFGQVTGLNRVSGGILP